MPESQYMNSLAHHLPKENGEYHGIIILKITNYLHFAYSSSTFTKYSSNLSPFLSTRWHQLACQAVFPMSTLKETVRVTRKTTAWQGWSESLTLWFSLKQDKGGADQCKPRGYVFLCKASWGFQLCWMMQHRIVSCILEDSILSGYYPIDDAMYHIAGSLYSSSSLSIKQYFEK